MPLKFSILILVLFLISYCKAHSNSLCSFSSCGKIRNISYPFRLETDPIINCRGKIWRNLSCTNNVTSLKLNSATFTVESIDYDKQTIRIVDSNIKTEDCSSLPRYSLTELNFTSNSARITVSPSVITSLHHARSRNSVTFLRCKKPVKSPPFIDVAPCINGSENGHFYAMAMEFARVSDIPSSCRIELTTIVSDSVKLIVANASFALVHRALVYGFELEWFPDQEPGDPIDIWDKFVDFFRRLHNNSYYRRAIVICVLVLIALVLAGRFAFGSFFVIILLLYKWRRRHLSIYNQIEEFLQSYDLVPIRFSHSELKKMTTGFKDKLGNGGYGSVYKGNLGGARYVAVKMLDDSKGDGEDFINEVATIGRIHHINIVRLIGFCVEGSKRAVVYDFMPNGSLDRYIFQRDKNDQSLGTQKMFEICLGVARGIEYLHRGCEIQILHFDIKPHNILLDESFVPKISDFGLARLCPSNNDTVTLTAARGTLGYIAPELFYHNIGGVSYKADVYSFGMLLMEMASRRKNLYQGAEKSSQVHFPTWVSDQFSEGNDINLGVSSEEESNLIKKMMIVALWCVQFRPDDRPSMSKVVEMLEEEECESLQMPPTKFSFSPEYRPNESTSTPWSSYSTSRDSSPQTNMSGLR